MQLRVPFFFTAAALTATMLGAAEVKVTDAEEAVYDDEAKQSKRNLAAIYEEYGNVPIPQAPKSYDSFMGALENTGVIANPKVVYYFKDFNNEQEAGQLSNSASSAGGIFGFQTGAWHNTHVRMAFYTSQAFTYFNPKDPQRVSNVIVKNDGGSYTYIGEASLQYGTDKANIVAGNFLFNSPFADTDNERMSPNTFQGVNAALRVDNFRFIPFYFSRWAGYSSANAQQNLSDFKKMGATPDDDSFGVVGGSVRYSFQENSYADVWYYYGDNYSSMWYAEGFYDVHFNKNLALDGGVQYCSFNSVGGSNIQGDCAGVSLKLSYDFNRIESKNRHSFRGVRSKSTSEDITFGIGYNYAWINGNNFITEGYGGGPYFAATDYYDVSVVSAELASLPGYNASNVWGLTTGVQGNWDVIGLDRLNTGLFYGYYKPTGFGGLYDEFNILVKWFIIENLYFDIMYSFVNQKIEAQNLTLDQGFQRSTMRLQYAF